MSWQDDLEHLYVTETNPKPPSSPIKLPGPSAQGDQGEEGDIEEGEATDDEMPPILEPTMTTVSADEVDGPSTQLRSTLNILKDSPKRRKTIDETSSFNTSDRKSKNCATFYFKHRDTDSEADAIDNDNELQNVIDESSEEEWTYTASPIDNYQPLYQEKKTNVVVRLDFGEPARIERVENIEYKHETIKGSQMEDMKIMEEDEDESKEVVESEDETKQDIQKLILEVEKLVSEEGRKGVTKNCPALLFEDSGSNNYRAKYARIKEWLRLNSNHDIEDRSSSQSWQPLDSCDASGEYTTGESDVEKQSDSSEDLQSSVATYRRCEGGFGCVSQSVSQETFNDNDKTLVNDVKMGPVDASTPKVVMRSKKKSDGPRPWSVSCVFRQLNNTNDSSISQFSISETALHQLVPSPPTKSVSLDAT